MVEINDYGNPSSIIEILVVIVLCGNPNRIVNVISIAIHAGIFPPLANLFSVSVGDLLGVRDCREGRSKCWNQHHPEYRECDQSGPNNG